MEQSFGEAFRNNTPLHVLHYALYTPEQANQIYLDFGSGLGVVLEVLSY